MANVQAAMNDQAPNSQGSTAFTGRNKSSIVYSDASGVLRDGNRLNHCNYRGSRYSGLS
jgi:hypothetical protein